MGDKQLLLVGVDPGTTLGYAAIDFEGNIIKLYSNKNLDRDTLISELIKLGKPLIIAGDKEHNPDFVSNLAVKLGARVIGPDYDLKVSEKRDITRGIETGNQHEIDALASAFFAFKKLGPLLKKINIFVEHYNKSDIKKQLIEFVVGKGINIRDAVEIIDGPKKEETRIIKDVVEERRLSEKDFLELYKKLKVSERDIVLLRKQNLKLKDEIISLRKDYEYMFKRISKASQDKKMQSLLNFKEGKIKFFDKQVNKKEDEIKSMQNETTTLLYFLSNMNSSVLLKKLDNLGVNEFEKKRDLLNINEGDVLLIKDLDIGSDKVILEIKGKVEVIFYKKPISKKVEWKLPFVFIDANSVDIEENEYFGIIDKKDFEKAKNKEGLLHKIVGDYRNERSI